LTGQLFGRANLILNIKINPDGDKNIQIPDFVQLFRLITIMFCERFGN